MVQNDVVEQVRDFLRHLYDFAYLQSHPLLNELKISNEFPPRERMRLARTKVLETVEDMGREKTSLRSPSVRDHSVLDLYYVEGLKIKEVARELAVSERQVYRDLRAAEQNLAALLCSIRESEGTSQDDSQEGDVLEEAERLYGSSEETCLDTLLDEVLGAVSKLAEIRAVRLQVEKSNVKILAANRQICRHILILTSSWVIKRARRDTAIKLFVKDEEGQICFEFLSQGSVYRESFPTIIKELLQSIGGQWSSRLSEENKAIVRLTLACGEERPTILVVDDNKGMLELFQRYLEEDYALIGAEDGREGLDLAGKINPEIIVLDVMMPGRDGWQVLQRLQAEKSTQSIPVVVCSVLDDPELAYSLGAAAFLAKPVNRSQLLVTLHKIL